jgi:hypothetical protein
MGRVDPGDVLPVGHTLDVEVGPTRLSVVFATAPVSMPIAMATEPQVHAPVVLVFADPPSLSDNAALSDKRVRRSCEDVAARCTPFARVI